MQDKFDNTTYMLGLYPSVFVHIDATVPHVRVPERYSADKHVILQLGYEMEVPVPDLKVNMAGIICTLVFSQQPFLCVLA